LETLVTDESGSDDDEGLEDLLEENHLEIIESENVTVLC